MSFPFLECHDLFTPPTRTRQNCLVGGVKCEHNWQPDKTRQFCLVRVGGVNKPLNDNAVIKPCDAETWTYYLGLHG